MGLSNEKSQSPKILGKRKLTEDNNNGSGRIRKNCRIDTVRTYPLHFGPDQGIAGDNAGIDAGDNVHSPVSSVSTNQNDRAGVSKGWEFDWVEVNRTEVEVIEISDEETEFDESEDSIDAEAAGDVATPVKVRQVLNIYRGLCAMLSLDDEDEFRLREPRRKQVYVKAAMILKNENRWLNCERAIGNVPGVNAGDEFQFRAELVVVGLHHEFQSTISYATMVDTDYAVSVVHSGPSEINGVFVFSAQGGISKVSKAWKGRMHQKGNLALKNSMDSNIPIRVIRKVEVQGKQVSYVYDGLYNVVRFWPERSSQGKMEHKFEMARLGAECFETRTHNHVISEDLSEGIEKFPITVVNDLNDEKPEPFTYISEMVVKIDREIPTPIGCDCEDGCSDSHPCACVKKNRGELPFNEDGAIVKAKKRIHECGPNCRCPPCCQNRVSQHGLKLPLEVFRTKSTGWGVRSRQEIPSGAFICEYLGELMEDLEADERTNDEYLLDLDDGTGFTIDAAKYGNVSRFINHSCSPNVYAQNVLYDHEDKKVPHVMFFATKTVPAMEELSYHYDYKIDGVRDASGNVKKKKKCFCGAPRCKGRLY